MLLGVLGHRDILITFTTGCEVVFSLKCALFDQFFEVMGSFFCVGRRKERTEPVNAREKANKKLAEKSPVRSAKRPARYGPLIWPIPKMKVTKPKMEAILCWPA